MFPAMAEAVAATGGTAYWKVTTATTNQAVGRDFDGLAIPAAKKYGLKVRVWASRRAVGVAGGRRRVEV